MKIFEIDKSHPGATMETSPYYARIIFKLPFETKADMKRFIRNNNIKIHIYDSQYPEDSKTMYIKDSMIEDTVEKCEELAEAEFEMLKRMVPNATIEKALISSLYNDTSYLYQSEEGK